MPPKKIVAMALLPASIQRTSPMRADLRYAAYSRATWEWWCDRHDAEFIVLDRPLGSGIYEKMAPSIRRWLAPAMLIDRYGSDSQIAMIDADTMIRWNTPDFFSLAEGRLAGVLDVGPRWIHQDIEAYQPLFPGVRLDWWTYINVGLVVLGAAHLRAITAFLDYVTTRWPEIQAMHASGHVSVDQTLLNFVLKRDQQDMLFLPPPFNLVRCVSMTPMLWAWENGTTTDETLLRPALQTATETFAFIDYSYIWHFTNVIRSRRLVMEETWRRVSDHYAGPD